MPRNASGIYTLPGGNPVTPGDVIEADWANTTLEDVADALTNSLSRTGAGGMLAPFRIADGSVSGPGLSYLNETNTGLYRSASGSVWMSILGVNTAQFSTVGLTIPFGKALTAAGNASVAGTFSVGGATTLGSTLAVTGAITATGGVTGNVTGNVTAATGTSTFNDVVITGALDMTAGSSATITGLSTPTNSSDAANKGYVDTQDALRLALTGGTMSGAIAMGNSKITGLATPTADADAATKAYVDSVAQGLDVKGSCRVGTTANITLSGTQTIDGVAVIAGDRVLVKNQSSAAENGIYVVAAGSWSRAADADTWAELVGAFTFVEEGTVNDNSGWVCTSPAGGTLGVTAVTWEQFSGAGQITAGAGLFKSGNTINVGTASSARIVVGTDDIDLATTGVTASTYKSVTVDAYGRVTAGTNPTTLAGYGITDAYTQAQVDSALALKLNLTGGTMSGVIAMGANKITGLADPTLAQDAATKNYIDTIFGSTTTAAASAAAAAASASAASSSATSASSSATAAAGSATSAAASFTAFDNQYLGSNASDPSTNNTGGALVEGNLYWNSTVNEMRVYDGSAWTAAYLPAAGYMDLSTNQTAAGVKTFSSNPILSGGTANGVTYLNGSKVLTSGSALTFDGTNLGIGVTPSAWRSFYRVLQAPGGSAFVGRNDGGIETITTANAYRDSGGTWRYVGTGVALRYAQDSDGNKWSYATSGNAGDAITFTQAMTLDASGHLNIGITSGSSDTVLYANESANATRYVVMANGNTGSSAAAVFNASAGSGGDGRLWAYGINHSTQANNVALYNHNGSGSLLLGTGGATKATLNISGNLGLGVTPSAWYSGNKAIQFGNYSSVHNSSSGFTALNCNTYNDASGNPIALNTGRSASYIQSVGTSAHAWNIAASVSAGATQTFTQAMTLDASGNLGVGTTSPNSKITVNANNADGLFIRSADTNYSQLNIGVSTSSVYTYLQSASSGTGTVLPLAVYIGTSERARFTTTGGFSVGTTADPGSGAIYATGNITAYYSDDRLKTRLGNIENALDKVDQLSGFYYEANETAQALGYKVKREVGVSAQSVQAVLPEIVSPAPIDQQYLTIDYERLVPLLIEAIKELRAEVNALKGV